MLFKNLITGNILKVENKQTIELMEESKRYAPYSPDKKSKGKKDAVADSPVDQTEEQPTE